jgi:hypothetical protein
MKNVAIFVTGAAVGAFVTWKLIEKKYRDLAEEEIQSVVDTFKNRKEMESVKKPSEEKVYTAGYSQIIKDNDYTVINEIDQPEPEEDVDDDDCLVDIDEGEEIIPPYVIKPEQFGESEEYGTKTLTYYADGVLTDEVNDPIVDPDIMIGPDALNHFDEYERDAVYIRDEMNEMDYTILRSEKTFSEISGEDAPF